MKRKNILDEMQEQKRLQIESSGLWIAYFGLLVTIIVQGFIPGCEFRTIAGETIMLFALAIYMIPNYIRSGIWSTNIKPTFESNLIVSAVAGLVVALINGISSYLRYHKAMGSIATALFSFGFTFIITMLILTVSLLIFKHRVKKIEDSPESSEDSPHL